MGGWETRSRERGYRPKSSHRRQVCWNCRVCDGVTGSWGDIVSGGGGRPRHFRDRRGRKGGKGEVIGLKTPEGGPGEAGGRNPRPPTSDNLTLSGNKAQLECGRTLIYKAKRFTDTLPQDY